MICLRSARAHVWKSEDTFVTLMSLHDFQGLNQGQQICAASTVTYRAITSTSCPLLNHFYLVELGLPILIFYMLLGSPHMWL